MAVTIATTVLCLCLCVGVFHVEAWRADIKKLELALEAEQENPDEVIDAGLAANSDFHKRQKEKAENAQMVGPIKIDEELALEIEQEKLDEVTDAQLAAIIDFHKHQKEKEENAQMVVPIEIDKAAQDNAARLFQYMEERDCDGVDGINTTSKDKPPCLRLESESGLPSVYLIALSLQWENYVNGEQCPQKTPAAVCLAPEVHFPYKGKPHEQMGTIGSRLRSVRFKVRSRPGYGNQPRNFPLHVTFPVRQAQFKDADKVTSESTFEVYCDKQVHNFWLGHDVKQIRIRTEKHIIGANKFAIEINGYTWKGKF